MTAPPTQNATTCCAWCSRPFARRADGGKTQRFCCSGCRRAFGAAIRAWVRRAIAAGNLTVAELRDAAATTSAFVPARSDLPPLPRQRKKASAHRGRNFSRDCLQTY